MDPVKLIQMNKIPPAPPDKPIPTVPPDKPTHRNTSNTLNSPNYYAAIAVVEPKTTNTSSKPLNHIENNNETLLQLNQLSIAPIRNIEFKPTIRPLLKLPCIINEWTSSTVMIDSGAACNCITRRFAVDNGIEILESEPLNITLADKSTTSSNQICHVRITLPSVNITFRCILVVLNESSHEMILGMNFLRHQPKHQLEESYHRH